MSIAGRCIAASTASGMFVGPGMHRNSRPLATLMRVGSPPEYRNAGCEDLVNSGLTSSSAVGFDRPGQLDPERAAVAQLGLKSHASAHPLGGLLHDGEADSSTLVARAQPVEDAEQGPVRVLAHADAVVLEQEADASVV